MRTIKIELFTFDELSKEIKLNVLERFRYYQVEDLEWWEFLCEDARNIGLEITSFDLDHNTIEGHLIFSEDYTKVQILNNHGKTTNTFKAAKKSDNLLHDLKEEYLSLLRTEYEYLTSNEVIEECIISNDYEFRSDGSTL